MITEIRIKRDWEIAIHATIQLLSSEKNKFIIYFIFVCLEKF